MKVGSLSWVKKGMNAGLHQERGLEMQQSAGQIYIVITVSQRLIGVANRECPGLETLGQGLRLERCGSWLLFSFSVLVICYYEA